MGLNKKDSKNGVFIILLYNERIKKESFDT